MKKDAKPRERFKKLVNTQRPITPHLPLVHSTDVYAFSDIVSGKSLSPSPCSVFDGEMLTYLFYGRPSYRPNINEEPTSLGHYLPIVIIFKPNWLSEIKRIFPFDSGAFSRGFYKHFIHKMMSLEDFELDTDPETPGRVVSQFYARTKIT